MAFFRIKKIKGMEYAYVVENTWKKGGSRQKVKSYLGRVYKFELKNNIGFLEFLKIENLQNYVENNSKNRIINDLVEWEFFKFDVRKNEFQVDFNNITISKKNKNAVLMINDGYLCNLTLKELIEFKAEGDEQQDGYRLARAFVEAGIKVPQEVFVTFFWKTI